MATVRMATVGVLLFVAALVAGCASIKGYPDDLPSSLALAELKHLEHYFKDDVFLEFKNADGEAKKKEYRDEVVNGRLRAIDIAFMIFEKSINTEHNAVQLGTDVTVLGLTETAAVIGSASTKSILSAISGGLTGAKLAADKALFYEKTMPALLQQMEAARDAQLVEIRERLGESTEVYPLAQALNDVDMYFKVGTVPGALIAISNQSGTTTADAKGKMADLVRGSKITGKVKEVKEVKEAPANSTITVDLDNDGGPAETFRVIPSARITLADGKRAGSLSDVGPGDKVSMTISKTTGTRSVSAIRVLP